LVFGEGHDGERGSDRFGCGLVLGLYRAAEAQYALLNAGGFAAAVF